MKAAFSIGFLPLLASLGCSPQIRDQPQTSPPAASASIVDPAPVASNVTSASSQSSSTKVAYSRNRAGAFDICVDKLDGAKATNEFCLALDGDKPMQVPTALRFIDESTVLFGLISGEVGTLDLHTRSTRIVQTFTGTRIARVVLDRDSHGIYARQCAATPSFPRPQCADTDPCAVVGGSAQTCPPFELGKVEGFPAAPRDVSVTFTERDPKPGPSAIEVSRAIVCQSKDSRTEIVPVARLPKADPLNLAVVGVPGLPNALLVLGDHRYQGLQMTKLWLASSCGSIAETLDEPIGIGPADSVAAGPDDYWAHAAASGGWNIRYRDAVVGEAAQKPAFWPERNVAR